ncbi:MAG: hypothetical protein H0U28_14195 [Nocardioidaceae bacterium]|nr:hypothetical protein [Nocardioidaceae bacterium]
METASGDDLVVLALRDGADFLRVRTQQGNDELSLPGFDYAWSGYGDDTITGSADRNVIFSDDGNDDISGLGGDDRLNASYGVSDIARCGRGHDQCLDAEKTFSCEGVDPLFPRGSCPRLTPVETSRADAAAC